MAVFSSAPRRRPALGDQASGRQLPEALRRMLPGRFEAVGEALASGVDATAACGEVGRGVARDGAALGEALNGLRTTYALITGGAPSFEASQALAVAWSEESLQYLHQLSCEDPLTGLTSLAHVRTRLSEIYRDGERSGRLPQNSHALVVVELRHQQSTTTLEHAFTRVLRLVQLSEALRSVFSGGETIGSLGPHRAVVLSRRDAGLGASVALLAGYLEDLRLGSPRPRVWIEALPPRDQSAAQLLDELAR